MPDCWYRFRCWPSASAARLGKSGEVGDGVPIYIYVSQREGAVHSVPGFPSRPWFPYSISFGFSRGCIEYNGLSISKTISAITAPAALLYALNSSGGHTSITIAVDLSKLASVSTIRSLTCLAIAGSLIIVLGTPLAPCIDLHSSRIPTVIFGRQSCVTACLNAPLFSCSTLRTQGVSPSAAFHFLNTNLICLLELNLGLSTQW